MRLFFNKLSSCFWPNSSFDNIDLKEYRLKKENLYEETLFNDFSI